MLQRKMAWFVLASTVGFMALAGCSGDSKKETADPDTAQDLSSDIGVDVPVPADVVDLAPGDTLDVTPQDLPPADIADELPEPDVADLTPDPDLAPAPCEGTELTRSLVNEPDFTFEHGPYLMMLKPDSVIVMWRTLEDSDGAVLFGTEGPDQQVLDPETRRIHEVTLTGLQPDTEYQYQVTSGGITSKVHRFKTAIPANQPFRFTVIGDNQNGPDIFKTIIDMMLAGGPHILVGTGDHVQTGSEDALWKEQLFDPARALMHQIPFFAAKGNHEGNPQFYRSFTAYPHPDDSPGGETYYWYTYGNAFFLVIDTNTLICPIGDMDVPQSAFIKAALATPEAQNATWKFAYGHEPGISESWSAGDCDYDGQDCLRNWLHPLLAAEGFHAWFSGHTHDYERASVDGMMHYINGGAGGSLDEWCKDFEQTTVVYQNHHYLRIDAGCDQLRIDMVNLAGDVVDWVVMTPDRTIVEQGPIENLPDLIISSDSPTRNP